MRGIKNERYKMKNGFLPFFVLIWVFSVMAGCADSKENDTPDTDTDSEVPPVGSPDTGSDTDNELSTVPDTGTGTEQSGTHTEAGTAPDSETATENVDTGTSGGTNLTNDTHTTEDTNTAINADTAVDTHTTEETDSAEDIMALFVQLPDTMSETPREMHILYHTDATLSSVVADVPVPVLTLPQIPSELYSQTPDITPGTYYVTVVLFVEGGGIGLPIENKDLSWTTQLYIPTNTAAPEYGSADLGVQLAPHTN